MWKVSVIVPTYRRAESLGKALDSLGRQTCRDFEVLVVDDNGDSGWNETVCQIVTGFQHSYPAMAVQLLVNRENLGSARARNVGIAAAEGEYVTFLDDDDLYLEDKLKLQLQFMEKGGLDYSITDLNLYNSRDQLVQRRIHSHLQKASPQELHRYHLMHHMTGTDTLMFRREYLLGIGCFPFIDQGDEFHLMERAIAGGGQLGYLPECQVKAYVHTGEEGMSSGAGKLRGERALYAYKKIFFGQMDARTRRYIRMRHYAVMAFAQLRRGRLLSCGGYGVIALLADPAALLRMAISRNVTG